MTTVENQKLYFSRSNTYNVSNTYYELVIRMTSVLVCNCFDQKTNNFISCQNYNVVKIIKTYGNRIKDYIKRG